MASDGYDRYVSKMRDLAPHVVVRCTSRDGGSLEWKSASKSAETSNSDCHSRILWWRPDASRQWMTHQIEMPKFAHKSGSFR